MFQSQSLVVLMLIGFISYGNIVDCKKPFFDKDVRGLRVGGTMEVCGDTVLHINSIEDSRCPANVNCFWAGQAKVQLLLSNKVTSNVVDLIIGGRPQNSAQVTLGGTVYTVTLENVAPYPGTGMDSQPSEAVVQVICS